MKGNTRSPAVARKSRS